MLFHRDPDHNPDHNPDHGWDRLADVVVLGSGAAGMVAATVASDGGADVVLLEGTRMLGGTTGVSGGNAVDPAQPPPGRARRD